MYKVLFIFVAYLYFLPLSFSGVNFNSDIDFNQELESFEGAWIELLPNEKLQLQTMTNSDKEFPARSEVEKLISYQTSVKRQRARGTCTIFSTIGLVESHLKRRSLLNQTYVSDFDFSEEWLEYLAMRNKTSEGSSTSANIRYLLERGLAQETDWEYIGKKWPSINTSDLAKERCGQLNYDRKISCLWGHRDPQLLITSDQKLLDPQSTLYDPEFLKIKKSAIVQLNKNIKPIFKQRHSFKINSLKWVKTYINKGHSLIMGLKLYYGSWNHSKTVKFDIQPRDKERWYQGIVGHPEPGSKDKRICDQKGGGHSLIIVGYDDNRIIKTKMLMDDGSIKEFSYKGVYYFKNSWGVGGHGRDFTLNGVNYPGYGVITQKYAHEHGRFFHLPTYK
jgi:hypothetical protein